MIERLIEFVGIFVLCYLIYLFGVILRKKRNTFDKNNLKVEEAYLISKYNLDMTKINYKKYLHFISIVNSLIFSITFQVVTLLDGLIWQILLSIVVLFPFFTYPFFL